MLCLWCVHCETNVDFCLVFQRHISEYEEIRLKNIEDNKAIVSVLTKVVTVDFVTYLCRLLL